MELVIVQLTDIHIRDDEDFDVLSERINSIGGAIWGARTFSWTK